MNARTIYAVTLAGLTIGWSITWLALALAGAGA